MTKRRNEKLELKVGKTYETATGSRWKCVRKTGLVSYPFLCESDRMPADIRGMFPIECLNTASEYDHFFA